MANEKTYEGYSGKMPDGLTIHVTPPPNSLKYLRFEFLVGQRIQGLEMIVPGDPDFVALKLHDMAYAIEHAMREYRKNKANEKKTAGT